MRSVRPHAGTGATTADAGTSLARGGATHLRARERVRRHLHAARPAPAQPRRGRPLPLPPGRVAGAARATSSSRTAPASTSTSAATPSTPRPSATRSHDLVVHDKAGERILEGLVRSAEQRLREEGIRGEVYLFKNNTDSAGNSYGCHENYLVEREGDFTKFTDVLIPFLVTRQVYAGAGKVLQTARGAMYCVEPAGRAHLGRRVERHHPVAPDHQHARRAARRRRALPPPARDRRRLEHERVHDVPQGRRDVDHPAHARRGRARRGATSRSRTRSAPSARSATTSRAAAGCASPTGASSRRSRSRRSTSTARCGSPSAAGSPPLEQQALEMWEHVMTHLENDPLKLTTEVDWVIKYHLIEAYRERHDLPLTHPRVALLDLAYHDVTRGRSLYYLLERRGAGRAHRHRRGDRRGDHHAAADHAGPAARRVHQAGQGAQARLHGRLGAPEAQRPGAAHGALQGPVQVARRARRAPHRRLCSARRPMPSFRTGTVVTLLEERPGLQRVEVDLGDGPERAYVLTQLTGRVDAGDARRREHHRGRARARHRRLARRALEPRARRVERAGARPHHQGPLHEPPGRRRQHRGAPRGAGRGRVDRRHAGRRGRAAQPGARGRGRVQGAARPTPGSRT